MYDPDRFSSILPALDGATILITGGTGSFGKHFAKTAIGRYRLKKLIIFSRDELKQHEMANHSDFVGREELRFFIGDVRDRDRLLMAMRDVDYVIHAAALKHVPIAEYNPFECIHTNVLGAENVVQAAIRTGVKRLVALSTDKAANPINLYGASKLAADKIFVAANNLSGRAGTLFSVVRYGNVLGSRGSVVPFFRQRLANGETSLPITDKRMTRFWITLRQGVNFVLSCLHVMRGGEVFVPKIPSMKIIDLAEALAPGIATHTVGIRPGEKLHELMIARDDARTTVELQDRYILLPPALFRFVHANTVYDPNQQSVPESFEYSSHNNEWWLSRDEFLQALDAAEHD